jgi:hypothetical protein
MWNFIVAGALYLIGVAVILVIKPTFMFTPDGVWKEFGIGKSKDRYTPFPFWLFCLTWAVVSYVLVLLLLPFVVDTNEIKAANLANSGKKNMRNRRPAVIHEDNAEFDSGLEFDDDDLLTQEQGAKLRKGYYVLNRKASKIAGAPKYVYLGEEEP